MPKSGFGKDYKILSPFDYPKLSLDVGEKARICVVDQPDYEFIHTFRAVVTENGRPKMVKQNLPGGREIEKPATDYRGQYICLGDIETLQKRQVDPDNCPACKAAVENGAAVQKPERRYIVHVLQYTTKKGTFNPTTPFSVEVKAWSFNGKKHDQLSDIADEHGDISRIDLMLGPSEPPQQFQKWPFSAAGAAEWTKTPENQELALATLKNNKSEDLTQLLGRRVDATEMRGVAQEMVNIYNAAFGIAGQMPAQAEAALPQESADIDRELSSLLDEETSKNDEPTNEELARTEEKEAEPVKEGGTESLKDLLNAL